MIGDTQLRINALKKAMSVEIPAEYPLKTRQEMAAGRQVLIRNLADSAIEEGHKELTRRFGFKSIRQAKAALDETTGVWTAQVIVRTAAKTEMYFREPLLDFPSDFMIAQIALVA